MDTEMPVRVMLVADDIALRRRVSTLLSPFADMDVIADVPDGPLVPSVARYLRPDLVLIDIQTPAWVRGQTIFRIRAVSPRSRVIALIGEMDERQVRAAFRAGVMALIGHAEIGESFAALIRGATRGRPGRSSMPSIFVSTG